MTKATKLFLITAIVFVGFLFFSDTASAQQVRINNFNVVQRTIPSTASLVDFRLTISQQDQNLTCPRGYLDWVVFYAAAPDGLPFWVRSRSIDSRNTNLPLSPNPLNLDFSQPNFIPNRLMTNQGYAFFRAVLGCNLGAGYIIYRNNLAMSSSVCVDITGGARNCSSVGSGGGPGGGGSGGGPGASVSFEIPNPIQATSLIDLAKAIGKFLFQIAIPIAVIIIIYAGFLYLTSGGNKEKVATAHKALWYAVIGLAVILIGQGFFVLIKSILDLGG